MPILLRLAAIDVKWFLILLFIDHGVAAFLPSLLIRFNHDFHAIQRRYLLHMLRECSADGARMGVSPDSIEGHIIYSSLAGIILPVLLPRIRLVANLTVAELQSADLILIMLFHRLFLGVEASIDSLLLHRVTIHAALLAFVICTRK